jgi:hypothetical protein
MVDFGTTIAMVDICWNLWIGVVLITSDIDPLPISGCLLIVFTFVPWLPHAIHELLRGNIRLCLLSLCGFGPLITYEGIAASPEFEFATAVLGGLPKMCVYVYAELVGRNLLFGNRDTHFGDWAILLGIALNGAILAPTAKNMYESRNDDNADDTRPPEEAGYWFYIVCGADMVALVTTVGTVGVLWGHVRFAQWLVILWLMCGLWPAISAPPPMPTLRPALPARGCHWFLHRLLSSVLFIITVPPLAYNWVLPLSQRWVWPFSGLMRTLMIVSTVPIGWVRHHHMVHKYEEPSHWNWHSWRTLFPPTATMDAFIVTCVIIMAGHTLTRSIYLLYRQSADLAAAEEEDLSLKTAEKLPSYGIA